MKELSEAELDALVDEATVDAYGEDKELTGRFLALRQQHQRKPSLQERFDKAGLPRLALSRRAAAPRPLRGAEHPGFWK